MEEIQTPPPPAIRIAVLLLSWNQRAALLASLQSLYASTIVDSLQVIVMDCASRDGSQQIDAEFQDVQMLRLPRHFGWTRAHNAGARSAKADYLLFWPVGVSAEPDCLEQMLLAIEGDDRAGAVCPNGLERDLPLPELGEAAKSGRADGLRQLSYPRDWPLLLRRSTVASMNYFSERYGQNFADADLALRLRRSNRPILLIENAVAMRTVQPDQPALSPAAQAELDADFALGQAAYLGLHFGAGKALGHRVGTILNALLGLLTFGGGKGLSYAWTYFAAVSSGQKIDGLQRHYGNT
jgi:glycosyltransferase involved in cell wall biosynthesis